jgi:hypothetical protein
VNFKQSCGLFERGDALQERACPYGEYPRHFSAIRLQKGGLNSSCFFGGFPVAPKSPFGHTLLHSAKLNSDLYYKHNRKKGRKKEKRNGFQLSFSLMYKTEHGTAVCKAFYQHRASPFADA